MISGPSLRARVSAFAVLALFGVAGCGGDSDDGDPETEDGQEAAEDDFGDDPLPEPEFDDDETVALPIGLVSPAGYDWEIYDADDPARPDQPHNHQIARTEMFGCENYISVMRTVPMVTDDPTTSALEYLSSMDTSQHGDPAFLNPLASSGLDVAGAEYDGERVTVHMTGTPGSTDVCQSWQLLRQIETTARAATGAREAEVLVDEVPLSAQLGLEDRGPVTIHTLD
ncbi:hypothetical protein [Nesterenkonia sphaerica]|uniref:GerMN domain-containing protein n=1 Tax=Nesterenkonia sphaerica TaxID=1804988 RepID=A0A5R9AK56_9MICC|nr:hypothetical protein [Nesterenkonia sphaerica]TLP78968.1 hypothetical protein FEF27_03695 [Nesterenkonia sphaerica]